MKARPVLFLFMSLCSSLILNVADRSVESRRFERRYDTTGLIFNVLGEDARSSLRCGALCARSSSCKAFCYSDSPSTALCHLSQPYDPIVQEYNVSDSKCYNPTGCPKTKGYAWYGARCIKGYVDWKNYTDARAICTQDGGHLYHYKAREWDMQPIVDLIADVVNIYPLWLGADALETGGLYKWSDSSLVAASLWRPLYPVDDTQRSCVLLGRTSYLLWNYVCVSIRKVVCQIDV